MTHKPCLDVLFQQFQTEIFTHKHIHKIQATNPPSTTSFITYCFDAKLFWWLTTLFFNAVGIHYYFNSQNEQTDVTAFLSMLSLLITIMARAPIINRLLFIFSSYFKNYWLHQVIYRLGELHRLMAITSVVWLFFHLYIKPISKPFIDEFLLSSILFIMPFIMLTALDIFRHKYHGWFENIHRYFSYLALILLLGYFHVSCLQKGINYEQYLMLPEFYILLFIILFSLSPWIGLKKIQPIIQHTGDHVVAFKIAGEPQFGSFTRITLGDYQFHSFGDSIYDLQDKEAYTLFITASGNRTKDIVNAAKNKHNLLKSCYMRHDRSFGFMYHLTTYDYVLVVATGGGIAPVIPHLVLNKKTKMIVLWLGHDQVKEFSNDFFINLRRDLNVENIRLHLFNSSLPWIKQMSIQDTTELIIKAYQHYCPEALFIVSNPVLTEQTLMACRKHRIKGYGATFDS